MSKRPTIQKLAREAGVSPSTVDRIINGRSTVRRATVEHVLMVGERIGFHGVAAIRRQLEATVPERTFGFLLNSDDRSLYRQMGRVLEQETRRLTGMKARAVIRYLKDLDPDRSAQELLALGEECDAIGCVCMDHPQVNLAVSRLARNNIPVIGMITALSSTDCAGFVGSNDWQIGRTAGWMMNRLTGPQARIATLIGSSYFMCQQAHEAAFRNYLRREKPGAEMLPTLQTEETDSTAVERARQVLADPATRPDGIFIAGGGLEVITGLCRDLGPDRPVLIGTEITERTREDLSANNIDVILCHPVYDIARQSVIALGATVGWQQNDPQIRDLVPFELLVSENC